MTALKRAEFKALLAFDAAAAIEEPLDAVVVEQLHTTEAISRYVGRPEALKNLQSRAAARRMGHIGVQDAEATLSKLFGEFGILPLKFLHALDEALDRRYAHRDGSQEAT